MDEADRPRVRHVRVGAENAGRRIDNFLAAELGRVPRAYVYRILRRGEVRVNGRRVRAGHRLAEGDEVRIPPHRPAPTASPPAPESGRWLQSRVLFEDDGLLVLDKPAGLPVHGGSGHAAGVIELLRAARPGACLELVHRLDRDTSGCLMIAKSPQRLRALQADAAKADFGKRYLTLVRGRWPEALTRVDMPLPDRRDGRGGTGEAPMREATTRFRLLDHLAGASYVEAELETGRMHQIRLHAAGRGHPIAGDHRHGDPAFNRRLRSLGLERLFLHAHRLHIAGGSMHEEVVVSAPLPADLRSLLERLGG